MIIRSNVHWPVSSCPIVGYKKDFGQSLTAHQSRGQDKQECFFRIASQHGGAPSSTVALRPASNNIELKSDSANGCLAVSGLRQRRHV